MAFGLSGFCRFSFVFILVEFKFSTQPTGSSEYEENSDKELGNYDLTH